MLVLSGSIRCAIKILFIVIGLGLPAANALALPCDLIGGAAPFIDHDLNNNPSTSLSYCELCGYGYVTIVITNPYEGADMINMTVVENLGSSGLVYDPTAPNPIRYTINGIPVAGPPPAGGGSVLTFNLAALPLNSGPGINNTSEMTITFAVRRSSSLSEEGLIGAFRNIRATLSYNTNQGCPVALQDTGVDVLPLREPRPSVDKRGRNVDATQTAGQYSNNIYGNIDDDVIWRIRIRNTGSADLQDLKFDDLMDNNNFQINYACPTEAEANAIAVADGVGPVGNCVNANNTINDFNVTSPFGDGATSPDGYEVDVEFTGDRRTDIFLVGKITNSCNPNSVNTVSGIQWGCGENSPPVGGITATSTGFSPNNDSEFSSSRVINNGLNITRSLTGLYPGQPVGSRGEMQILLDNNTGGSIKNIHLRNILPPEYVVDSTFAPTVTVTGRYGPYPGMADDIVWTNPAPNTDPLTSSNPAEPLANIAPEFDLVSTGGAHPDHPDQVNMLRHGDTALITFRVVMIPPAYYDNNANLDVRVENTGDTTDPNNSTTLTNQLFVDFEQFCNPGVLQQPGAYPYVDNFPSAPEDLDIDITGSELIFILTNNPAQPLPLQVALRNNGGHTADDYYAYVSFGATMDVVSAPAGCSVTSTPPPLEVWEDPADIPATATVYECTSAGIGTVAPNQTRSLNFEVIKTSDLGRLAEDDLSFRADVVGEVTLENGTPLWFPTPAAAPIANRANNYSLDGVRARVIGFNLIKDQVGNCTENNPPPAIPDLQVQIGEECTFHIETGGWFGFQTPGFTYIAVQAITVTDQFPDGQGYISSTDPALTSDLEIRSIVLSPQNSPPLQPLDEGWIDWSFNQAVPAERITVRDKWFRVNVTSRLLNDPIDPIDPANPNDPTVLPNRHAVLSTNVLNSVFQAVFFNSVTSSEEVYNLGPSTIGYPQEAVRREDLTITEPNILVTKEVCNETLYGAGTACSNFAALVDDGDTQDSYIYRVTLTNEAASVGAPRAPAYNITSTDILDASDLVLVVPFNGDGLDNDGDGLIDAADINGEGSISDNIISNAIPATITFSHTHSNGLLRLDPGASITLYYRVDPDDAVAPQQTLINTVTATFDSLEGASGNQTVVLGANSTSGGARVYGTVPASATVQILPLQTQPKDIIALSNTPLAAVQPQPVSVGEEIEYELRTYIPVANLRDFYVRDELPAGIRCTEAPVVDLNAPPYSAAGFFPGGQITPTCNDNLVYWYFGDQELTTAPSNQLFEFPVRFIARVENTATVNDGDSISNGVPATNAIVSYLNEAGTQITLNFDQADLLVREPQIALTKSLETNINDAGDVITVTVTATNNGTATAYNLRVFDDLAAVSNLTFLGNVGGTDPPDNVDTTTFGANRPVFSWNAANPDFAIAPGATISFTFDIAVDIGTQPLEILDNTIQASWTSLPAQTTALNSTGLIGADGSVIGMRNGALPNVGDAINDYETTATDFSAVPALTMSKTDLNPALAPEVGAHRNFELVIQLPEGTTNNLVVSDQLDFAGTSYVLSNNAGFDISYSFENIASINGSPPDESALIAFPADTTSGVAVWNFGQVVTASEDDTTVAPAITPVIRINYFARANNDLVTNSGIALQNTATTTYNNGETGVVVTITDNTPAVTVIEPVLTISKTVTPITPLPVTGGDILEYVLTIPNSGTATAYDVNLVDTLPAQLGLDPGFTPTAAIDGTAVGGFIAIPAGAPNGPLIWGLGNADGSLDIPAGSTLILTYHAAVDATAQSNITLSNSALVDWTSLEGGSSYERTGAGCPTITAPNDYCAGPAVASVGTIDTNSQVKSVVSDTYAPANDAIVRIGDTITYRLSLNLQEGTTRNVAVQDVLPAGLAFVDIVSINADSSADYTPPASGVGSNFSYAAITAAALPTAGQTGALSFTLGDVVNDPAGDATTDTLVIEYRARVVEDVLAQAPSTTLTNTATLSYTDGSGTPVVDPARLESSASITVLQPVLTLPTKIDRSARTSPANVNVATDIMNFQLESCNTTGQAPAYNVQLTDALATQLDQTSISGPVNGVGQPDVYINGAVASSGVDYVYTPPAARGGSMVFSLITAVDPGQCVTVDYDIGFYTDFGPNQSWDNSVIVDEYWSLPLQSGQQYGPLGPTIFTMTNVATIEPASKAMLGPASGEATIGEEVVYQINVPSVAANAALYDVVITDNLHPSLEYLSATEISGTGLVMVDNTTAPGSVSLAIAQIPAGQQAVIELRARVANNASANAGISFTNTSNYTYAISAGGSVIVGGSATTPTSLTIVEPQLAIVKNVANLSNAGNPPRAGDVLRYTLTLTAVGTGAGDNFSDVFDVRIDDSLSLSLAYQAGTATVDGAGNTIIDPVISGDGNTTPQTLVWDPGSATADIDVAEGATVTITYDVLVLDSVLANQNLSNSAAAQWTGLDGVDANERNGTGTPAVNDYFTAPVTTT
ncbi:MAG: isopeptide-forming domain-containing fimbrial protein, partial [Gammaproteobacteria bacterium]|nr:isopeptide-forming domain-containing fimbrial protein [Gammaproteobacteria bacterium]